MEWVYPLDTDIVGNLPDSEVFVDATAVSADDNSFKDLDSLLLAFLDELVYSNGVAGAKRWKVCFCLRAVELIYDVHGFFT